MSGRLRLWALGVAGALGLLPTSGCSNRPASPAAPQAAAPANGEPESRETPPTEAAHRPPSLVEPFPARSQLQFGPHDEFLAGGLQVIASPSEPVNTEEPDRDYFTDPAFDQGENSGRLFNVAFTLANRQNSDAPWRYLPYIYWRPLNAEQGLAQLLYPRPGLRAEEVTTDGKSLFVHHRPLQGSREKARVDRYAWEGDAHGHGSWVLDGPAPKLDLPATPDEAEQALREARQASKEHDQERALELLEKAVAARPNADAYVEIGKVLGKQGVTPGSERARKAIDAYTHALALEPKRAGAHWERGYLYRFEKRYDEAIADFTRVIELEPGEIDGYLRRADVHADRGDYRKAAADAETATRKRPEEADAWADLCRYEYRLDRNEAAARSAAKAIQLDAMANEARLVLGYMAARKGDAAAAVRQVQDAEDNGLTTDQRAEGMAEIERLLQKEPRSSALQAILAKLKARAG